MSRRRLGGAGPGAEAAAFPAPEREGARPAWYALQPGRWRDYLTLLHPPYTAWHLSYVAIGAALAPRFEPVRLWWGLAAFFLALGVAAHALDELNGRPLATRIPGAALVALAAVSLAGAAAIGIGAAITWGYGLLAFVAAGVFLVLAYDLELFGGRFHGDAWFALAWGAFPALTGYFVEAQTIRAEAVLAALFAAALSAAQRVLSTPAREARRSGGVVEPLPEAALRALTVAVTALAAALVVVRM